MKRIFSQGILALMFLFLISCSEKRAVETEPLPPLDYNSLHFDHSMKGWELYSWPNGTDWNYSVIIGTNTLKSYDMVSQNTIAVTGSDLLKKILELMPEGEEIVWIGEEWLSQIWEDDYRDLMLPPEDIILDVNQFCQNNNLLLIIVY